MDTIPNRHNPERIPSQMDTILNGQYAERRHLNGHHLECNTIPNAHLLKRTLSRMDTIPNRFDLKWIQS